MMKIGRRELIAGVAGSVGVRALSAAPQDGQEMFGLIGKMTAVEGKRDALIAILIESVASMPGCLSYVIAKDSADENAIWITEVWDRKASHDASLALPAVKKAIAAGRPMIAGFGNNVTTTPVGGLGLPNAKTNR
jgi:quinol monooxygenase YgiN